MERAYGSCPVVVIPDPIGDPAILIEKLDSRLRGNDNGARV